jgi:hypothetical protein
MSSIPRIDVRVYTFAAREAARMVHQRAGSGAMKLGASSPVVVALSMPLDWMAEGFLHAVRRFEEADLPGTVETKDACIPLFDALSWLWAIDETHAPATLAGNSDVRALRFVRNRQHHHKAAPIRRGQDVDQWIWHGAGTIPQPRRDEYGGGKEGQRVYEIHLDKKGQGVYTRQLADTPVRDVLNRLAQLIGPLAD